MKRQRIAGTVTLTINEAPLRLEDLIAPTPTPLDRRVDRALATVATTREPRYRVHVYRENIRQNAERRRYAGRLLPSVVVRDMTRPDRYLLVYAARQVESVTREAATPLPGGAVAFTESDTAPEVRLSPDGPWQRVTDAMLDEHEHDIGVFGCGVRIEEEVR